MADTLDALHARYRTDCRLFRGEKPCGVQESCVPCDGYRPMGYRVLVVKLAAIGDVLRTTPLLPVLRQRHDPCHVTWLTDPGAAELLRTTPGIDRLLTYSLEAVVELQAQAFDLLLCLDKEPRATGLATAIRAAEKRGFGMTPHGSLTFFNPAAEYAYRLGLSDDLKFKQNSKTYPQIILEAVDMTSDPLPPYQFEVSAEEAAEAERRLLAEGVPAGSLRVGLNTGCGPVFATKKWTEDGFVGLATELASAPGSPRVEAILLGGPDERARNPRILARARAAGARVHDGGCDNSLRQFAALVSRLDLLVTGDTLALHLGVAARVPTLAIMGSTSAAEIELYGRGAKVVTDFPCAPCYLKVCPLPVTCMEAMPVSRVAAAAHELLARRATTRSTASA